MKGGRNIESKIIVSCRIGNISYKYVNIIYRIRIFRMLQYSHKADGQC